MPKEKVRVIIAGVSGSGKSTIAQIIVQALKAHGIDHQLTSSFSKENQLVGPVFQGNRVKAVKEKTEVSVEELQTHRLAGNWGGPNG